MFTRILIAATGAILLSFAAFGAENPKFHNTDISGSGYGKTFRLTDQHGEERSLADFKGKVVTVFFGFTYCPDVCPTTLATMKTVKRELGENGKRLQVIFITVDPERDTQEQLARYMNAFDPSFIGLRGDAEATLQVAREFMVFFQKATGDTPDSYTIDHSAGTYIYDPQGHLRLHVRYGASAESMVDDIRLLFAGE